MVWTLSLMDCVLAITVWYHLSSFFGAYSQIKEGYDKLYDQVKSWLQSLCQDPPVIHKTLKTGGKTTVCLGKWQCAASSLHLKGPVKKASLWMDSFDPVLQGKHTTSYRGLNWSYKVNRPGCHILALQDGQGLFLYLITLRGCYDTPPFPIGIRIKGDALTI